MNIKCFYMKRIFRRMYGCFIVEEVFNGVDEIFKIEILLDFMYVCSICEFYLNNFYLNVYYVLWLVV